MCQHRCRDAHIQALKEHYMLVGETIMNHECRNFLMIESEHIAKRILQKLQLPRSGSNKYASYKWSL